LQTKSAEKQVKVTTLPLIQFNHINWNNDDLFWQKLNKERWKMNLKVC